MYEVLVHTSANFFFTIFREKLKRKFEEPYVVFYHLLKQDIKHVESLPFVFNPNVMEGPQAS